LPGPLHAALGAGEDHTYTKEGAMPYFINCNNQNLVNEINALSPTAGFCLFIDISGSTKLKDFCRSNWVLKIMNTFNLTRTFLGDAWPPVKSIGDELMIWVNEGKINPVTIFNGLVNQINEPTSSFQPVKISLCHCCDSFEMTFFKDKPDVYGKDIDLTARLMQKAEESEIVMNERYYKLLINDPTVKDNLAANPEIKRIVGPEVTTLKGFEGKVSYYKWWPNIRATTPRC
jgi:hypothetical protein